MGEGGMNKGDNLEQLSDVKFLLVADDVDMIVELVLFIALKDASDVSHDVNGSTVHCPKSVSVPNC